MLRWCVLVCLGGCGRIAFGETQDGGTIDHAFDTLPPQVCRATATSVAVTNTPVDLVATPLVQGGVGAAWVATQPASVPQYVLVDDSGQPTTGPDTLDTQGVVGDIANSLVDLGDRMYFVFHDDATSHHIGFGYAGNVDYVGQWPSAPGRDCVSRDEDAAAVWSGNNGTMLDLLYVTTGPAAGTRSVFDTGGAIAALACHDGPEHIHVGWHDGAGTCTGLNVITGGPMPMAGTAFVLSTDCVDGRTALVDKANDTSLVVWSTAAGTVEAAFATNTLDPAVQLSSNGRGVRGRSDGTLLWFAWTELTGNRDALSVGYKTRNGPLTTVPLPGIVPAGPESYELIREGATVSLVVLTTDGFVRVLELCAT